MIVRSATGLDVWALADLYREAALRAGPEYYSPRQVRAWAAFADETDAFRDFILKATTIVAEEMGRIVGFGGLEPSGHIASLYVHPDRFRHGVGSALLTALIDMAVAREIPRLFAETNLMSRPLFERFGFDVVGVETVARADATFERYIVERRLYS